MPTPRRKPRARAVRCAFRIDGKRCVRNGTGNPSLCADHRRATGQPQQFDPNGALADAVKRAARGQHVSTSGIVGALGELFNYFVQAAPEPKPGPVRNAWDDLQRAAAQAQANARSRVDRPPEPATEPPRATWDWWSTPPDPRAEAKRIETLRARAVLGFTNSESLTVEKIKDRQRALARKHHPDLGGSEAKMKAINAASDVLLESLA